MGFACNALAYGVIRRAGSLTLKVLGTVKNVAVVGAGMALFGDKVALLQAVGYAVSIGGFVSYQRVKAGGSGNGKEQAGAASGNGEGSGNKVEVSSFLPAKAAAAAASAAAADGDSNDASELNEKRPLLPASFVPALSAHDSTSSLLPLSSSSAAAVPAAPHSSVSSDSSSSLAPLSTVDAITAKLSGFFTFGAATATAATNEIAAGRV